jgi:hypothetical protein
MTFNWLKRRLRLAIFTTALLAACTPAATQTFQVHSPTPDDGGSTSVPETTTNSNPSATSTVNPLLDDFVFQPLLPYDGIRPIYNPEFVNASDSPLLEDELVMGVAIQGEAKAFPVTVLRFREMVDDELGGLPILVTW